MLGSEWLNKTFVEAEVVCAGPESHGGWSDLSSKLPGRWPESEEERRLGDLVLSVVCGLGGCKIASESALILEK